MLTVLAEGQHKATLAHKGGTVPAAGTEPLPNSQHLCQAGSNRREQSPSMGCQPRNGKPRGRTHRAQAKRRAARSKPQTGSSGRAGVPERGTGKAARALGRGPQATRTRAQLVEAAPKTRFLPGTKADTGSQEQGCPLAELQTRKPGQPKSLLTEVQHGL